MRLHKAWFRAGVVALLTVCSAMAGVAKSQDGQTATASPSESLLIGPGDVLHVIVFDAPELDQHSRVTDSGEFPLIVGGNIKVAGMTPERAANAIGQYLVSLHELVNPRISVTVETYATQTVSVLGAVMLPGAYPISTARSLSDVLALAGGLKPDADRAIVVERRNSGEMLTFYNSNDPRKVPDSSTPGTKRDGTQLSSREALIYPGDIVRVAHAELVFVLGDVGKPGGFPIVNNDAPLTALQLVALGGGTNHTAVPGSARLIRKLPDGKFEDIHLPLGKMQRGKVADRPLQAGDIIYVPFSFLRNAYLAAGGIAVAATSASIYAAY